MNKAERKELFLNRQYKALETIARSCGVENPNGAKMSSKLRAIELNIGRLSLQYTNNAWFDKSKLDKAVKAAKEDIKKMFNNNLKGFFIDLDPRGYALKIEDDIFRDNYKDSLLRTDFQGYGLLAPEITGTN